MKFDLQVSRKTFDELLRSHKQLEIPPFQRPYSWETKQWSQLWEDLTTHLGNDYLMGGIVLCGTDDGHDLVIDGQQRTTTITILIAACRDYLFKNCEGHSKARDAAIAIHNDYIVSGGVIAERNDPYLILGELDREWFTSRIQVSPSASAEYSPPDTAKVPYKLPGSNRLLWRAYQYFSKALIKWLGHKGTEERISEVIKMTRQVASKTWFVITRVPDDTQAYTLFEV